MNITISEQLRTALVDFLDDTIDTDSGDDWTVEKETLGAIKDGATVNLVGDHLRHLRSELVLFACDVLEGGSAEALILAHNALGTAISIDQTPDERFVTTMRKAVAEHENGR